MNDSLFLYVLDLSGTEVWTVNSDNDAINALGKNGYGKEILVTEEYNRIGSVYSLPIIQSFPDRSCLVVEKVGEGYCIKHKESGIFLKVSRYLSAD